MDLLVLLGALLVILAGAELFTNGIEWFGRKRGLGEGAVGSVLAAVGTAMPETMIPLVAIVFSPGEGSDEVGIGAILGAPFMLATLAMFVTGLGVLAFRRRRFSGAVVAINQGVILQDTRGFFVSFAVAVGVAFLPAGLEAVKLVAAIGLVLFYLRYVLRHLGAEAAEHEAELAPLRLGAVDRRARPDDPRLATVVVQVVVSLGLIVAGAWLFVGAVEQVSSQLGVDELLLALIIAPIATELPEKFNSVIWVRQGKDTLALGNITGAMVFQSTFPVAVGLVFTDWRLWGGGDWHAAVAAGVALFSGLVLYLQLRFTKRGFGVGSLLFGGLLYGAFLGVTLWSIL
jgi:cation:H+ antiporter